MLLCKIKYRRDLVCEVEIAKKTPQEHYGNFINCSNNSQNYIKLMLYAKYLYQNKISLFNKLQIKSGLISWLLKLQAYEHLWVFLTLQFGEILDYHFRTTSGI